MNSVEAVDTDAVLTAVEIPSKVAAEVANCASDPSSAKSVDYSTIIYDKLSQFHSGVLTDRVGEAIFSILESEFVSDTRSLRVIVRQVAVRPTSSTKRHRCTRQAIVVAAFQDQFE